MKKKQVEKKKRKHVRDRDWSDAQKAEFAFSRDQVKHRRATVKLSDKALEVEGLPRDFVTNGTVISHTKKWAFVWLEDHVHTCIIDERLQEKECTLLAAGDEVYVEFEEEDAIVRGIAPRRTRLSRPEAGNPERPFEQVIAANVDVLLIVAAISHPPFRAGLIDRFLIAAQLGGVAPLLVLNKMDLEEEEPAELEDYRALGVTVQKTSCMSGAGIEALREALRGKVCALCGHSGVGKSSLLNALQPELDLHTQSVTTSDRGRHTTTAGRLYTLECGTRIIDTPGIRSLGLWGVSPEELSWFFPEIAEVAQVCKFRNCTHTHEPQCAVTAAVEAGTLSRYRYESYLRIRASLESDMNITPGRMTAKYVGHHQ